MANMYERIDSLLQSKGITGAKMSSDLGMSRSFMTELRKGRAKSVKLETAQKIANYLGVSVEYLTTGVPANIYECPNDENPWEIELLDAFDQLDVDHQIAAVEHVQNLVAFNDDSDEEVKKAPTVSSERSVSDDDIKFALFGGDGEITDAMYERVKQFAAFIKQEEAGKKKE